MTMQDDINRKIMDLRLYLQMSKAEFGKCVGYSATHITRLENGESAPKEEFLDNLCRKFCLRSDYFRGGLSLEKALKDNGIDDTRWRGKDDKGSSSGRESMLYDGKAPQRIKELRELRGISQRKLALISGVDNSLVSQVESGDRRLSLNAAEKIADALEVGSGWLLYGNEYMKEYPVNRELIDYLWDNEDIRRDLWDRMKEG